MAFDIPIVSVVFCCLPCLPPIQTHPPSALLGSTLSPSRLTPTGHVNRVSSWVQPIGGMDWRQDWREKMVGRRGERSGHFFPHCQPTAEA